MTGMNPALLFPPLLLNSAFSWANLLLSCGVLALLFAIAIVLFNPESVGSEKNYRDTLAPLMQRLSFLPNPPLAVIWFFLSLLGQFFPPSCWGSRSRFTR